MAQRTASSILVGAVLLSSALHAPPVFKASRALIGMVGFVDQARAAAHGYIWERYYMEIPIEKKKEPPKEEKKEEPPPPEPDPAPLPMPKLKAPPKEAPKEESRPPAAAKAGKVLTAPDDKSASDDEPADFTMVTGKGEVYAGGTTAANGTSDKAVYDANAKGGVKPGGTGKGKGEPGPAVKKGPDLSKPARPTSFNWRGCPFPPEADDDDIDNATVVVIVSVRANGRPAGVSVRSNPGHGFGRAARMCALTKSYSAALGPDGKPKAGKTPPITIMFRR